METQRILLRAVSLSVAEKRSANGQIDSLLRQFPGKRIVDLLEYISRCYPETTLAVALERAERIIHGLTSADQTFLERFKKSLG